MSTRLSLTLQPDDERVVASFAVEGSAEQQALSEWAHDHGFGDQRIASEATLLRLLIRAGAHALHERAMDVGYSALALSYTSEEHAETRAARIAYVQRTEAAAGE